MTIKLNSGRSEAAKRKLASLAALLMTGVMLGALAPAVMAQEGGAATEAPAAEAPAAEAPAAPTPETVVATLGDQTITEADIAFAAEDLQDNLAQIPPEQRRGFLVSVLIDMKLMAKAAREAGMDQTELFKRRSQYLEESALRRAFFGEKIASMITEDSLKADYDAYVAAYQPQEEVHARHILVETKEEADAVEAELAAGKPFEVLAMEKTTDPSGKQNGGDLGFFAKGQMVPEFETAAFALEPGKISEPIQSQFGWHIIKLEEKRMTSPASFQQMMSQLGQAAMAKAFNDELVKLRAATPVDIPDPALAAAVQAESAPAGAATEGQ
jgi:peptidyl-prolyl cis-trans isomerase C